MLTTVQGGPRMSAHVFLLYILFTQDASDPQGGTCHLHIIGTQRKVEPHG